jgi:CspA family cold shock protein
MQMRGTIKFFETSRGYGFIKPDGGGPDIFVHISAVTGGTPPQTDDKVEFELGDDRKSGRPKAMKVSIIR